MVRLTRTVRFSVNPAGIGASVRTANGTGGIPAMTGIGAYYELDAECVGIPDPRTGYLINIKDIDHFVRTHAVPIIARAFHDAPSREPIELLSAIIAALRADLPDLTLVRWRLTPTYAVEMETATMSKAVIKQVFEIAAAHRLHVESLPDAENRRVFGKCNNPNGHGHNYRFQPAVEIDLADNTTPPFTLADLETLTEATLVERFDHKHLNLDTPEFGANGVNPSVENIARVFFDLLAPKVRETTRERATLRAMTVWETEKTSATYPA